MEIEIFLSYKPKVKVLTTKFNHKHNTHKVTAGLIPREQIGTWLVAKMKKKAMKKTGTHDPLLFSCLSSERIKVIFVFLVKTMREPEREDEDENWDIVFNRQFLIYH